MIAAPIQQDDLFFALETAKGEMADDGQTLRALAALATLFAAAWLMVFVTKAPRRRFRRAVARRDPIDAVTFVARYYPRSEVSAELASRVRQVYGQRFDLDPEKLLPADNAYLVLTRGDDVAWRYELQEPLGIELSAGDAEQLDGSLDALLRVVARRQQAG